MHDDLLDDIEPDDGAPFEPLANRGPGNDADRADWHLRNIARLRTERADIDEIFTREMQRLAQRRTDRLAIIDRAIERHELPLTQWHAAVLATDPKAKTIHLPHGDLKSRVEHPKVCITDPDALLEWARANRPELLTSKVNVSDLRRATAVFDPVDTPAVAVDDRTGELVPGTSVTPGGVTFSVKLADDGSDW